MTSTSRLPAIDMHPSGLWRQEQELFCMRNTYRSLTPHMLYQEPASNYVHLFLFVEGFDVAFLSIQPYIIEMSWMLPGI